VPFSILALRTGEDTDATIWPVPAVRTADGPVTEPERLDGARVVHIPVTSVTISELTGGGLKQQMRLQKIPAAWVTITDSRVIFAATKWDTGSTYLGFGVGAVVGLAATGVSKARAAARSRGKVLAAQVRYPCLSRAGAATRNGRQGSDQIRLGFGTKTASVSQAFVMDLTLPVGTVSPVAAVQDIVRRCAAYRLAHYPNKTRR